MFLNAEAKRRIAQSIAPTCSHQAKRNTGRKDGDRCLDVGGGKSVRMKRRCSQAMTQLPLGAGVSNNLLAGVFGQV